MAKRGKPVEPDTKNPHAVALGRMGGLVGGKVSAQNLTAAQRKERSSKAIAARWAKKEAHEAASKAALARWANTKAN